MNDPYKILGVEPTATDKEIKTAYKGLVRKYHPDRFQDEAMAEMANEKMTEINAAYDKIMDDRKNGRSGFTSYTAGGASGGYRRYSRESYEQASGGGVSGDYYPIRNRIHAGSPKRIICSITWRSRTAWRSGTSSRALSAISAAG